MIEGQFAVAFAAGLVAVANPCGFAMLPAYLSFFLGVEGQDTDARAGLARALAVGLSVSAGFALTFFVIDQVIRHVTGDVLDWSPWVSIVIGIAVAALGVALAAGKELKVNLPRLDRGGRSGSGLVRVGGGLAHGRLAAQIRLLLGKIKGGVDYADPSAPMAKKHVGGVESIGALLGRTTQIRPARADVVLPVGLHHFAQAMLGQDQLPRRRVLVIDIQHPLLDQP